MTGDQQVTGGKHRDHRAMLTLKGNGPFIPAFTQSLTSEKRRSERKGRFSGEGNPKR